MLTNLFQGAGKDVPLVDNAALFKAMKRSDTQPENDNSGGDDEGVDEEGGLPRKKVKVSKQLKIEKMLMPYKPMPTRRVDVFFQRQYQDIMSKNWIVLQVTESRTTPGEFRMWTLVDGIVHQVTLDVPRTFYVNYFNDINPEDDTVGSEYADQAPEMILPRSKASDVLYRYKMSETEFQSKQKVLSELQTNPNVEGVYETQVPPIMRALSKLGCVCRVSPSAKRQKDIQRMSLDDLEFVNASNVPYFNEPPKTIYIYHRKCRLGRGYIGVLGMYFAAEKQAYIYGVSSGSDQDNLPSTGRITADGFEVTSARMSSLEDAYSEAEAILSDFYAKGHLSYVLVANAPFSERGLEEAIPATANYPKLYQPCDERASETVILKWEAEELAKMHKEFRGLDDWISAKVKTSHFGHVPIGNIGEDEVIEVSDVMFARVLQQNNHVLWVSQSNRPDIGGAQEDDNSLAASSSSSEELSREICAQGCYRTVCAELALSELTLSAIMNAENIIEGEGIASIFAFTDSFGESRVDSSDGRAKDISTAKSFGGSIEGIRPFKELVKMVHSWMNVSEDDETKMVKFLGSLYRWLTSTRSRFYEPAIIRIVTDLMNKLFLQLIHTIRTLGGGIVYANFNKIVINTYKYTREDAENFLAFILESVKRERLYVSLAFKVKHYWDILLFMDINNYCGTNIKYDDSSDSTVLTSDNDLDDEEDVLALILDGPGKGMKKETISDTDDDDPSTQELENPESNLKDLAYLKSQWSIAEYLPVAFHKAFSKLMLIFIGNIYKMKKKRMVPHESSSGEGLVSIMLSAASSSDAERASLITSKSAGISEYLSGSTIDDEDNRGGFSDGNLSKYSPVDTFLSQNFFDAVREMLSHHSNLKSGSENDKFDYVQSPGSAKNPILLFINLMCQIFSIDKCSENKVSRLKSGVLKLLDISMFSPEAEFKLTGSSFIIPGIICKNCLDLK